MKNLDRYLRYEVDLEKHEASMREQMARKENEEMGVAKTDGLGQLKAQSPPGNIFVGINLIADVGQTRVSSKNFFVTIHLSRQSH